MLSRYGTSNIIVMLIVGAGLIITGIMLIFPLLSIILISIGALVVLFTFWFFRDPERSIPVIAKENNGIILSPADGRVVEIVEEDEPYFLATKAIRISIFLSPLDVHVNRSPVSGIVRYTKYFPGEFLVAYHPKASEKNEQSHIGVDTTHGKVLFKQIVGILARRVVFDLNLGDEIKAGDRFGMMKFGSRMDILLPLNTNILIKTGDRVIAGESIIAEMN
jgi:phosphatidylserine decarboxylase